LSPCTCSAWAVVAIFGPHYLRGPNEEVQLASWHKIKL
jgi:hypothetical protein